MFAVKMKKSQETAAIILLKDLCGLDLALAGRLVTKREMRDALIIQVSPKVPDWLAEAEAIKRGFEVINPSSNAIQTEARLFFLVEAAKKAYQEGDLMSFICQLQNL